MLKNENKKAVEEYIEKIDFVWKYNYALERVKEGKSKTINTAINRRISNYYMCYPDMG